MNGQTASRRPNALVEVDAGHRLPILGKTAIGAMWHICFAANSFVFPLYARFEKSDSISRMEFVVLFTLAHSEHLFARDITRMTGLPKNSISRGVNKLLDKGLVQDRPDDVDARRVVLSLTASGREMFDHLLPDYRKEADRILSILSDSERAQLEALSFKLACGIVTS